MILIAILIVVILSKNALATFTYDKTTETTCDGKVCTKTLYSGYSPSFFKNNISTEKNWLKFYDIIYLEKDPNFDLKILSFNNNSFVVNVKVNSIYKNQQIPLKLCNEISTEDSISLVCPNVSIRMNILDRNVTVGINPLLLDRISFGFNSTTITLNEINGGNFEELTFDEVKEKYPDIYEFRNNNKFESSWPGGESYKSLVKRLEPVLLKIENASNNLIIIAHQAICRIIYAYLMDIDPKDCVNMDIDSHRLFEFNMIKNKRHVTHYDI